MVSSYTLLMTACIAPPNRGLDLKRLDPHLRLEDYIEAYKFWLSYPDHRIKSIVFVENSGFCLNEFKCIATSNNIYNRDLEFIEVFPAALNEKLHYGYDELEMIDDAFYKSACIKNYHYIIKVTGRLYFPSLSELLDRMTSNILFLADSRDYNLGIREKHFVVTTLFIVNADFYKKHLLEKKEYLKKTNFKYIENLFFSILKPLQEDIRSGVILRFPFNVEPKGVGAHANINYQSINKVLPSKLRNICRKYFPKFWI